MVKVTMVAHRADGAGNARPGGLAKWTTAAMTPFLSAQHEQFLLLLCRKLARGRLWWGLASQQAGAHTVHLRVFYHLEALQK